MANKREAILLSQADRKNIANRKTAKDMSLYLKISDYTNPVKDMEENIRVSLLYSFATSSYQKILLVSDQKVTAMQMPLMFEEMKST